MPNDELPFPAKFINHRRRVTGFFRRERAPNLLAGVLVERHRHTSLSAGKANELLTIDEWMSGEAPERSGNPKLLLKLARPQHLPAGRFQAEEISFRAKRIDFASSDDWRRARPGWITHVIGAV